MQHATATMFRKYILVPGAFYFRLGGIGDVQAERVRLSILTLATFCEEPGVNLTGK